MFVKCAWALLFFLLHFRNAMFYIENVEVSGCESCTLFLTCRHFNSIIAVLDAKFESYENVSTTTTTNDTFPTVFPPVHPRQALNRRCSGVAHCSFILTQDCPGADQWGPGNLTVKYVCISERRKRKYCNSEIVLPSSQNALGVSEGFVHNPGYPRFYSGQLECKWIIKAPSSQNVKITILDLSVAVGASDPEDECSDHLEVKDSDQVIYKSCITEEPPAEIQSGSDTLEVVLLSSRKINPRRGVLFYYSAVGCPTPPAPKNGFIVYRNDTVALISCCLGYVFPDTGLGKREVTCLGHRWDVDLKFLDCCKETMGKTLQPEITQELKPQAPKLAVESSISELLIPTAIIVALFIINFIVLLLIYKYRQRHVTECEDEELEVLLAPSRVLARISGRPVRRFRLRPPAVPPKMV